MRHGTRVIAMGFFDGVHIGHAALLNKTVQRGRKLGISTAALSFDAHPDKLVTGSPVPLILSPLDRADVIKRLFGIEDLIVLHFDENMMKMPWRDFLNWLSDEFGAVHFIAGYDFRFGHKGEGSAEKIREFCLEKGLGCDIVDKVTVKGETVSSSHIRELLSLGDIEAANEFLGHRYFITDTVRDGYRLGRKLGAPTINMRYEDGVLIPKKGVYATKAYVLETGQAYNCVTNIGVRPTVSGEGITVESHLLDFSGNLYGKKVRVEFYKFLRPEMTFLSTDELRQNIVKDAKNAREYFRNFKC